MKINTDYSHVIPDDIDMGEIYMATSKTTNKSYIGQAKCYTKRQGKFKKWGGINRWKTHITEAKSKKDHNKFLNTDIRKYGKDDFEIIILIKCKLDILDKMETQYIKERNTLEPNGYNILRGGSNRKFTEISKKRLSEAKKGTKLSDRTKLYISIRNIERHQFTIVSKYIREKKSKFIVNYPIINNNKLDFVVFTYNTLEDAKEKVNELEKVYNSSETINKIKLEAENKKKERLVKKTKPKIIILPKYISEIYQDNFMLGYRVSGYKYFDGTEPPAKDFIGSPTNTGDLHNATMYIKWLDIQNQNKQFIIPKLPKGIIFYKDKNRVGTPIEGFKVITGYKKSPTQNKNIPIYKKFSDMRITLEENYKNANDFHKTLPKNKKD
jgi:hypothetical protein